MLILIGSVSTTNFLRTSSVAHLERLELTRGVAPKSFEVAELPINGKGAWDRGNRLDCDPHLSEANVTPFHLHKARILPGVDQIT